MKSKISKLAPLLLPFLIMIAVNEWCRAHKQEKGYSRFGITAMNSNEVRTDRCTWNCHDNTSYCLEHHVRLLKPVLPITNRIYFGNIKLLMMTGAYGLANILLYVILWPFLLYRLYMRILRYRSIACK
ncbi:MAG: hypothetical protein EOO69_12790 [Moraxellaceae bacterium]|nr:MAG: hypothetical protein EOO69_12790 [Moraxellaceae bacterium]